MKNQMHVHCVTITLLQHNEQSKFACILYCTTLTSKYHGNYEYHGRKNLDIPVKKKWLQIRINFNIPLFTINDVFQCYMSMSLNTCELKFSNMALLLKMDQQQ